MNGRMVRAGFYGALSLGAVFVLILTDTIRLSEKAAEWAITWWIFPTGNLLKYFGLSPGQDKLTGFAFFGLILLEGALAGLAIAGLGTLLSRKRLKAGGHGADGRL